MRILTVITPSRLGGAEKYAGWLCKWESENGHAAAVACKPIPAVADWYKGLGLQVLTPNIAGKLNLCAVNRLRKIIRETRADVVHTHLSTASLWGSIAARKEDIACVSHVHSLNTRTAFRFATKIIAVSGAVKSHLVSQGIDPEAIEVVYPAQMSHAAPTFPAEDISALGPRVVTCASHLRKEKGQHILLQAFAEAAKEFPDARLVLAGEGAFANELQTLAKDLQIEDKTILTGFRSDMPSVFAASRIAVLPTIGAEGMPLVLREANAAGTPAIATDVGGVREIVRDGLNGYVVPPGDIAALQARLRELLSDKGPLEKMKAEALKAAKSWTFEDSARACMKVFEKTISG